nr:RNA-directed DNA polymerase homolog [Tanacetum cinerariifolium]
MPLNDPSLLIALKAQIQIGGTPQVNTFQATFHYQIAYQVQNHSLDILVPRHDNAGDALLIDVDSMGVKTKNAKTIRHKGANLYYTIDVVIKRFLTRLRVRLSDCKKWKFIRKKKQRGRTSDMCFICQKRDDEPSDSVLCTIAYSYLSSDNDSDTYSPESDSDFGVHMIYPIPHVLPIQEDPPLPLAKIHLLTDAYAKPILVIAFFDTGSTVSILNPNILPDYYWKPHHQNFMAANGEKFVIDKIGVLINIRLFLKCVIKRMFLGSSSHGKDLLIGFNILHKLLNLRWIDEQSHAELLSKFYSLVTKYGIILSKKKKEVVVTTILFLGMKIFDGKYQPQPHVAQESLKFLDELSSQKMIQQFLGLVNYLADYFGIKPEDRTKMEFCIPDHHYQWKVMPFGLKNAPSAFQKAMITILEPIPANTLVYINDILLFSLDGQSHAYLLSKFYSLVTKYGIMLSEKKIEVGVTTIQFLGMEIFNGKYQPQP